MATPGRSKMLIWIASGSACEEPTWKAASRFCAFSQCLPTGEGSVRRSTTCTPALFSPDRLAEDIQAALNSTEMAKRQFRELARVAGLVFPGFPRAGKTARQLQVSSGLFFDVLQRYDPGNLLLSQAAREVLERQLESTRLGIAMHRLSRAAVIVTHPRRVTPLGFPLLVDRTRERVSSESMADRIRRMQLALERAAG